MRGIEFYNLDKENFIANHKEYIPPKNYQKQLRKV